MLLSVATDEQSTNQQTNAVNFSLQNLHDLVTPFWTNNHSDTGLVQFYKGQFESSEFIQAQETNPNDFFLDWISNHGVDRFETKMVVGAKLSTPNVITAFYQPKVIHSQGIAVQLILDARVKAELGGEYSVRSGIQDDTSQLSEELHTFEFINLIFALVPILLASRIISERSEGSKHLQELCGTYPGAYWLGTFLFDYIVFTVVVLTIMMVLTIKPQKLIIHSRYVATFTFFMVYGLSSFPNIYFIEHFFNRTAIGIVFLIVIKVSGIFFVRMIALNNWFKSEDSAIIGTVSSMISPDYLFAYILLGLMNYDCTDDDAQTVSAVSPFLEKDFGLLYSIFIFLIIACFSWLAVFCIEFKLHIFLW
ncbi:uncharacterized protein LOC131946020 [Physella acuta]|uniref:uncharacterized protein LOC131946020 n=1 Tax=Physella acuta TaxID=109671 RepID=UPI0027DDB55F|nr:uncharacterized protein LOC131946020 [Physella acuta]